MKEETKKNTVSFTYNCSIKALSIQKSCAFSHQATISDARRLRKSGSYNSEVTISDARRLWKSGSYNSGS